MWVVVMSEIVSIVEQWNLVECIKEQCDTKLFKKLSCFSFKKAPLLVLLCRVKVVLGVRSQVIADKNFHDKVNQCANTETNVSTKLQKCRNLHVSKNTPFHSCCPQKLTQYFSCLMTLLKCICPFKGSSVVPFIHTSLNFLNFEVRIHGDHWHSG